MNPISTQIKDLEYAIAKIKECLPYADSRQARDADQERLKRLQAKLLYWKGIKEGIEAIQHQADLCEEASAEYNARPNDAQVVSRHFANAYNLRLTARELCKTALKGAA